MIEKNLEFSRFSNKYFNWGYNKALKCIVFHPRSFFVKMKSFYSFTKMNNIWSSKQANKKPSPNLLILQGAFTMLISE